MSQALYTPLAQSDLSEIFSFIAADDIEQSAKYLRLINDKCNLLAKFPYMGKPAMNFSSIFAVSPSKVISSSISRLRTV